MKKDEKTTKKINPTLTSCAARDAIHKELEEMRQEYSGIRHDPAQKEVLEDWECVIEDGLEEDVW